MKDQKKKLGPFWPNVLPENKIPSCLGLLCPRHKTRPDFARVLPIHESPPAEPFFRGR